MTMHLKPQVAIATVLCAVVLINAPAIGQDIRSPRSGAMLEDERNTIDVFRAVAPSTVFVTQKRRVRDRWTMSAREYTTGSGSGFVWDTKGHIVTNFHVINGARMTWRGML